VIMLIGLQRGREDSTRKNCECMAGSSKKRRCR
jgi:hypothetical protein